MESRGLLMKAQVFIGSSKEGVDIARAIQAELEPEFDCTIWNQQAFQLTRDNLSNLIGILAASDFGVFVFSPDDMATIRGQEQQIVRDNLIFELGLFIGKLDAARSFFVLPEPQSALGLAPK